MQPKQIGTKSGITKVVSCLDTEKFAILCCIMIILTVISLILLFTVDCGDNPIAFDPIIQVAGGFQFLFLLIHIKDQSRCNGPVAYAVHGVALAVYVSRWNVKYLQEGYSLPICNFYEKTKRLNLLDKIKSNKS